LANELQSLHLLVEWDEEGVRARRRQAVSLSAVAHLVVVILLLMEPHIFRSVGQSLGLEPGARLHRPLTFLALPPEDVESPKIKPKSGLPSDKDRAKQPGVPLPEQVTPKLPPVPIRPAEKPTPGPEDKKLLAQVLPPPPLPQDRTADKLANLPAAPPPLQLGDVTSNQQPKLALPPGAQPGRSLDETLRAMARNRAAGGQSGGEIEPPAGFTPRSPAAIGPAQILTDTMGVDFDPYLRRVLADIRRNWYAVMPEIARMGRRGRVVVIFDVQHDGGVPKLYLVSTSGFDPLDRAALAGISASVPFPALPAEFRGPLLRLQVTFLYNMVLQQ
jgi:TonB family protein